jgi:hypothetical protein
MSHRHSKNPSGKKKLSNNNNNKGKRKNGKSHRNEEEGVDFITRMDRKLRATRVKLEQQRQSEYKKDRDAAKHTDKTWEQVEKGFFKRLTSTSPTKLKIKENDQIEKLRRTRRTLGGKAALDLERRSAHGFNHLCQRAKVEFALLDVEASHWIEANDLTKLLDRLGHKPMPPPTSVVESDGDWVDYATMQLDRNKDGAIALSDFVPWWISQCPACVPLRGCYPEIHIDVRRIALDKKAAQWMRSQNNEQLGYLTHEYDRWVAASREKKEKKEKNEKKEKKWTHASTTSLAAMENAAVVNEGSNRNVLELLAAAPVAARSDTAPTQVPLVCDSCWSEYKRATFLETYDERSVEQQRLEQMRALQQNQIRERQDAQQLF